ncbi:MAG: dCMP deaminase family protein [Mycoplasmataceae bacterium]|nr:dCMP deaminase family protein [Mycoplasmataceae bacterium]
MANKRLSWDEYFMGIAIMTSKRSADPSSQVGCILVRPDNRIVSLGYNGFPKGSDDGAFSWEREGEWINTKYPYVVHDAINALLNAKGADLTGCKMYCNLFPCNDCAKALAQAGIAEIIYFENKHPEQDIYKAAAIMMKKMGIKCRQYVPTGTKIEIEI